MASTPLWLAALLLGLGVFTIATNAMRVVRKQSVQGIALTSIMLSACSASSWFTYGLGLHNATLVISNIVNLTGYVIILAIGQRTGVLNLRLSVLGSAAYAALAIAATIVAGMAGLGVVMSVLSFATRVPQLRTAWRHPGGAGISLTGQSSDVTQCSLWALNGFLLGDVFMVLTSSYCAAASLYVVVRALGTRQAVITPITNAPAHPAYPESAIA